jgi:hypothetical protein
LLEAYFQRLLGTLTRPFATPKPSDSCRRRSLLQQLLAELIVATVQDDYVLTAATSYHAAMSRALGGLRSLFDLAVSGEWEANDDPQSLQRQHALGPPDPRFDGIRTVTELEYQADFALGALDHNDGELVVLGGAAWRPASDGRTALLAPMPARRTRPAYPSNPRSRSPLSCPTTD